MDINAQKTKIPSMKEKLGDRLQKASSLLSVAAILMTVILFVRTETNTKMLDSKFTLKIKEMGDALESVRATLLRKDSDISNGRSSSRKFFNNYTSLAWRCCTWSILKQAERIRLRPLLVKTNKRLKKIYPMKCLCVWHFNANQPTNNWNVFEHFSWLWYIERSFVNTDLTLSQRLDPFIETSQDCPLYTYL